MSKLSLPSGVRRKGAPAPKTAPAAPKAKASKPSAGITVPAPKDGETVNVSVTKADGGHVVDINRHDKNWRTTGQEKMVVTGDPTISLKTETDE